MKPSEPNTDNLIKNSDAIKALSQLEETKENSEKRSQKKKATEREKKAKSTKQTRARKKKQKEKRREREIKSKEVASITEEAIDKLKRPFINAAGNEVEDYLVHTYKSATRELEKEGCKLIKELECGICSLFGLRIRSVEAATNKTDGSWLIPGITVNGTPYPVLIPPPPELYQDKNFPLSSDSDWDKVLQEYNESLVASRIASPIDELCNLIGLHTTDEAIDMRSPHITHSPLYQSSANSELKRQLIELGLLDLDKHYLDLGFEFLYPPDYPSLNGMVAIALTLECNKTHESSPSKLHDNDPRKQWCETDLEAVDKLKEELWELMKKSKFSKEATEVLQRSLQALMNFERILLMREEIQELALTAFKAGMDYNTNYSIANRFKDDQKGHAMSTGGYEKGLPKAKHRKLGKSLVEMFENERPGVHVTEKVFMEFMDDPKRKESKDELFEALKEAPKNALKRAIEDFRSTSKKA